MARERKTGEAESREILATRLQAWWLSVLAGQAVESQPVHGGSVEARVEAETIVLTGSVLTEQDRCEIEAEAEHWRGRGISDVRNELQVVPEVAHEPGLLVQTLLATYETAEQAGFAAGCLEGDAHVRPGLIEVLTPEEPGAAEAVVQAILPEAYREDALNALRDGRALLIATVDETEAFKARELLDEETQSPQTLVLPPEPAGRVKPAQQPPDETAPQKAARPIDEKAARASQHALRRERTTHDP